jgi:DNA-directed RNA polymerase subunit RPC12/RpoP
MNTNFLPGWLLHNRDPHRNLKLFQLLITIRSRIKIMMKQKCALPKPRFYEMFCPSMSEFKYACPVCGQHIKCDSAQAGSVMECPTCFQKITVPQAPASAEQKFILTGSKVTERKTTVLGAAAESSPRVPAAGNFPVVAVIIVILILAAGAGAFAFRGKLFKPVPATNTVKVVAPASQPHPAGAPETDDGNNLALNKPVSASSEEPQNPPQNGNDGNRMTRWCAATSTAPQWWEVDLGGLATVTNTKTMWEHRSGYRYVIEVSSDHTSWTTVADKSANFTATKFSSDDFSATARYVRIVITGLEQQSWASFFEFRVFGSTNLSK